MSSVSADLGAVVDEVQLAPTSPGVSVFRLNKRPLRENDFSAHTIVATSKNAIRVVDDTIEAAEKVIRATEIVRRALREPERIYPKERGPKNDPGELRPVRDDTEQNQTLQAGARHGLRLLFAASGILVIGVTIAFVIERFPFPKVSLADPDDQGRPVAMTSLVEAPSLPDTMPAIARDNRSENIEAAEVENSTRDTSNQDARATDSVSDRMLPRTQEITGHPIRHLKPEQIADLIERGSEFIALGDINSARVLFERAAEARDPKAAFALAATYDPVALQEIGIHVPAADLGMARDWYHKALEFGSLGASRRLELLASWDR
jgi:TPR repeat protein